MVEFLREFALFAEKMFKIYVDKGNNFLFSLSN